MTVTVAWNNLSGQRRQKVVIKWEILPWQVLKIKMIEIKIVFMNLMTGLGIPQTSLIIDATVLLDPTRVHGSSQNDPKNITQIIHSG